MKFHLNSARKRDVARSAKSARVISATPKPTRSTAYLKEWAALKCLEQLEGSFTRQKMYVLWKSGPSQGDHHALSTKALALTLLTKTSSAGLQDSPQPGEKCVSLSEELLNNSGPVTGSGRNGTTSVFFLHKHELDSFTLTADPSCVQDRLRWTSTWGLLGSGEESNGTESMLPLWICWFHDGNDDDVDRADDGGDDGHDDDVDGNHCAAAPVGASLDSSLIHNHGSRWTGSKSLLQNVYRTSPCAVALLNSLHPFQRDNAPEHNAAPWTHGVLRFKVGLDLNPTDTPSEWTGAGAGASSTSQH